MAPPVAEPYLSTYSRPPSVLAFRCDWQDTTVVVLHNLGPKTCQVELELDEELVHLFADQDYEDGGPELELGGYGYRWLRARR